MEKIIRFIKIILYFLLTIIIIYVGYLILNPIYFTGITVFLLPKRLNDLNESRNYFSSFQSIITIIVSIFGLILGYFYYNNRKKVDSNNALESRRKFYLDKLFEQINKYDHSILLILTNAGIKDEVLKLNRVIIEQTWDIIEAMIEPQISLLNFSESELEVIIKLNSFVDQNDLILHSDFKNVTPQDLNNIKSVYQELLKAVRLLCLKKIA